MQWRSLCLSRNIRGTSVEHNDEHAIRCCVTLAGRIPALPEHVDRGLGRVNTESWIFIILEVGWLFCNSLLLALNPFLRGLGAELCINARHRCIRNAV